MGVESRVGLSEPGEWEGVDCCMGTAYCMLCEVPANALRSAANMPKGENCLPGIRAHVELSAVLRGSATAKYSGGGVLGVVPCERGGPITPGRVSAAREGEQEVGGGGRKVMSWQSPSSLYGRLFGAQFGTWWVEINI